MTGDEGVPASKLANWHPTRDPWSWKVTGALVPFDHLVGIDTCTTDVGLCEHCREVGH